MSAITSPPTFAWPADVREFARRHGVEAYLDPLREAIARLFPTARGVTVGVEHDPELRDTAAVVFDVRVPAADVPDPVAARWAWHREQFRVCPAPVATCFGLDLHREG